MMKKVNGLILIMICLVLITSCGEGKNNIDNSDQTEAETVEQTVENNEKGKLTINPDDYYKVQLFSLPEDFRQAAVDHMRKQASIEWVCGADFSVSEEFANWDIDLTFKKGQTYHGLPYADTKVSYTQFEGMLVDGKYTCASSAWKDVAGVQCVSSIMNSIQQFDPSVAGTSSVLMPGSDKFEAKICGEYEVPLGKKRTADIISANSQDTIIKAYSQLKKGDIIGQRNAEKGTSHYRLVVEDAVIFTNSAGKINPQRSYVKTIEQTNAFDKQRTDGVKTNWFVDHIYTFDVLYKANYLPYTLEIYSKDISECEIPYILLDKEITPTQLEKRSLQSTIKSNFPIRYAYLDVYYKSGELVKRIAEGDFSDQRSISLRTRSYAVCEGLENGEYTFVVTCGIAIGSVELARVDFTYNK